MATAHLTADILQTIAGLLAAAFVFAKLLGEPEHGPLPLPMALLCFAICGLLLYAYSDAPPPGPYGWPAAIAMSVGMLGWLVWDQRHWLFGTPSSEIGQAPATGHSLFGTMLIALTEELVYRGMLLSATAAFFRGEGGLIMAVFVTNLIFALAHGNRGMIFAMSAGFFGLVMTMTVILSGSVWPAAITHMVWNMLIGVARQRASCQAPPIG